MAVLLVLASHGLGMVWFDMHQPFLPIGRLDCAAFLKNGLLGVDLFFVLSGFLITGQLLDGGIAVKEGRWQAIGRYFKRRACRIVPAYYLILTLTTAYIIVFDPYKSGAQPWARSYLFHLFFLQNYFYTNYYALFWSLAVEFQFYLLAPLFILLLLQVEWPALQYMAVIATGVALACLRMMAVLHQPVSSDFDDWFFDIRMRFPYSLDGILGGTLCNLLWRDAGIRAFLQRKYVCNSMFSGGLVLFLILAGLRPPLEIGANLFDKTFLLLFVAVAFSCMLLGLLSGSAGQKLFSSRPLRFLARVSYSMYLIHLTIMKKVFVVAWMLTRTFNHPSITYFTGLALLVGVTALLSAIMYRFVEKPFIDWSKKPSGQTPTAQAA